MKPLSFGNGFAPPGLGVAPAPQVQANPNPSAQLAVGVPFFGHAPASKAEAAPEGKLNLLA
jgi:hypothetical protein